MKPTLRIGLVGDRNDTYRAHAAIPKALALAAARTECDAVHDWLPTEALAALDDEARATKLAPYDALWCAPGSPYASLEGALGAIRFARERGVPFVGTCGGFQHAVLEYARDVAGIRDADHAESNPDAKDALITKLVCPLVQVEAEITLVTGSKLATLYGATRAVEGFYCRFGVNERYRGVLEDAGLRFTARDAAGEVRALELASHPFFLATLFQFELSAAKGAAHPLVVALLRAAAASTPASVSGS